MKKRNLIEMRKLYATPKMLRVAAEDIPQKVSIQRWGYTEVKEIRQYDLFVRCAVEADILKVSIFLPQAMRLGGKLSAYDIYVDKDRHQFLTYEHETSRWLTGMLNNIGLGYHTHGFLKQWISPAENKLIRKYFTTEEVGLDAILTFQKAVRARELELRHKRETDAWDQDLSQTPQLPKDWERWVNKVGIQDHFIFYDYVKGGATHGYCSYCEKEVPIKKPRHNKPGRCPCCRHKITFKATGRAGYIKTEQIHAYLMQPSRDGFMCREFLIAHNYPTGEYRKPEQYCHEIRRALFTSEGKQLRSYYWGVYKQRNLRWIKGGNCLPGYSPWQNSSDGRVYGKTLPCLAKRGLGRTGLIEHIRQQVIVDPERYLAVWNVVPQLEQLSKASLPVMVRECLNHYHSFTQKLNSGTSLTRMLGIDSQELKRLRENRGGFDYLAWLRCEKALGKEIPDQVISWFCKENICLDDVKFIIDRMSVVQIYHYIRRNMAEYRMKSKEVINTWADYLSMATRFKYDTSDALIYRTSKLRQRHNELAARGLNKPLTLQAGEILQKYPHLDDIITSLKEKYAYTGQDYIILAPDNLEELIMEGITLDHCIGKSERYWDRMERHESYLLFLRKAASPKEPYYTLEIEPGGTIRQIRSYGDEQYADIDKARTFLKKWQAIVAKRLTEDDRKKASASKVLRLQEFTQLQKDQVKVRIGRLTGRLLIDVLTADLMESVAA